jgi:pimeloyl-ACP methyl ester carboxylesterase
MPATQPAQAPGRYATWIDELKSLHRGTLELATYDGPEGVAQRLMKTNPRLTTDKAHWLARQWATANAQGRWEILGNPAHKVISATLSRVEETLEIYRRISAPVLSVTAGDDSLARWWKGTYTLQDFQERLRCVPQLESTVINDAGHMLHHDQPDALAREIERFLA